MIILFCINLKQKISYPNIEHLFMMPGGICASSVALIPVDSLSLKQAILRRSTTSTHYKRIARFSIFLILLFKQPLLGLAHCQFHAQ